MTIDKDRVPDFADLDAHDSELEARFDTLDGLETAAPDNVLARNEWRGQRHLSEVLVLLHNLGLSTVQLLAVYDLVDTREAAFDEFLRARLGMPAEAEPDQRHPAQESLEMASAQITEGLTDGLSEQQEAEVIDTTLHHTDLRRLGSGELLQLLGGIEQANRQ